MDEILLRGLLPSWGRAGMTLTIKMGKENPCSLKFGRGNLEAGSETFMISIPKNPNPSGTLEDEQEIHWLSMPKSALP